MNAAALANQNGSPEDLLIVAGQLFVTGQVETVGYKEIYVAGQALIPRENEAVVSSHLQVAGQIIWYSGEPRLFNGNEEFSVLFFEYLEEPVTLIINGMAKFQKGISPELLREKVTEIVLNGMIEAPAPLVPMLQVLTKEKNGSINVAGEEDGGE